MTDLIAGLAVLLAVGAALLYIRRAKKKGAKCIGCPSSGTCGKTCSCGAQQKKI